MAKARTSFLCRSCGGVQSKWMGKCPDCGAWDALEAYREPKAEKSDSLVESWRAADDGEASTPVATPLPEIEAADFQRIPTGLAEFDRVLGGGLVPGSVVLLGGDPGIGKSTLLLQASANVAQGGRPVLYVSSEESAYQTRLRAERLLEERGTDALDRLGALFMLADTSVGRILEQARKLKPALLVLDSIQMVYRSDLAASPGSIAQLRRCCMELVSFAKLTGTAVVLVGHITKDGKLAGPKLLEHLVDVVLSFEGDSQHAHRIVRGIKNRFGATFEVGLFEMTGRGLREVVDTKFLIDSAQDPRPGAVICPVMHGTRCLLVEIQALTAPGFPGSTKRRVSGLDANRLAMLIAVLEQHGGLRLADRDVFVSAVGGLKVNEPAADLALCLAIAGAHMRRKLPAGTVVFGEVGLGGEVRGVSQREQRTGEAARLGFRNLVVPVAAHGAGDLAFLPVRGLAEAMEILEGGAGQIDAGEPRGRNREPKTPIRQKTSKFNVSRSETPPEGCGMS